MFRIVEINKNNRRDVTERLRSNLLHNLFVIYDVLYEPERTSMHMVYGNDSSLKGYLLMYKGYQHLMGRLDGEEKSARKLLELIQKENMVLFCPPNLLHIVKKKFPQAHCYPEHQMHVVRGEEKLVVPNPARRLQPDYAALLAVLYSAAEPSFPRRGKDAKSC